jgi:protein gp37
MSKYTSIQWADGTINPIMGCDGCPLFPKPATIASALVDNLPFPEEFRPDLRRIVATEFGWYSTTVLYHLRAEIADKITNRLATIEGLEIPHDLSKQIMEQIASEVRCYAGFLHMRHGKDPRKPDKHTNKGYAPTFEEITKFPGRMAQAAKWSDLAGTDRPEDPWLNGLPRLIFVSDMGDALSQAVDFPYLKQEIIDVATSELGQAHIWLWLTKRPRRMAQFAKWLETQGIAWPDNLVPMTSVMDRTMAKQVKYLLDIPAKARGLSVEPLWEDVDLDLKGIDWVIAGGESGAYAKPFDLQWARSLQAQCSKAGASFFMKQMGAKPYQDGTLLALNDRHGGDWDEWPADLRVREMPAVFNELAVPRPAQVKQLK